MTTKVPDDMLAGGGGGDPVSPIPAGVYLPYGGAVAPEGWLLCYGQAVSRTTYAALFDAIGTGFGVGDGSTTFNVPDMRGRLPLGLDNMGGVAANRVTAAISGVASTTRGGTGGDQRLHAHNHSITDPGHAHVGGLAFDDLAAAGLDGSGPSTSSTGSSTTGISINNAGAGASQNMPPVLVGNYIIKT